MNRRLNEQTALQNLKRTNIHLLYFDHKIRWIDAPGVAARCLAGEVDWRMGCDERFHHSVK
ncbi:hypothetical protein [Desulfoluna limicola]|uniref:hypothetical protein n=1 Tax=Desulfoluna limicola TaxID=2810562 RepID=UPI001F462212|nr:hypothetical protein [Desulfoluna limicola]